MSNFFAPNLWDRLKGLKLRRFGKLNLYSCYGRSRRAALDEGEKESLVYCGLSTAAVLYILVILPLMGHSQPYLLYEGSIAAVDKAPRKTRESLVYLGTLSTAAPQR